MNNYQYWLGISCHLSRNLVEQFLLLFYIYSVNLVRNARPYFIKTWYLIVPTSVPIALPSAFAAIVSKLKKKNREPGKCVMGFLGKWRVQYFGFFFQRAACYYRHWFIFLFFCPRLGLCWGSNIYYMYKGWVKVVNKNCLQLHIWVMLLKLHTPSLRILFAKHSSLL